MNFGIIGTNFISERFLEAAGQTPEIQVSTVYSRSEQTGQAFASKYGISNVETDFQSFCRSEAFTCAYIASPNCCHADQAAALLSSGKHVLCEKPLATDMDSFTKMKQASLSSQRVLMEAMRSAYDPAYDVLRKNLCKIGRLRRVCLEFCQYSSRYDKYQEGILLNAFNPALGNAAVMDIGVYCIYLMLDFFGVPKQIFSSSVMLPNGMEGSGSVLFQYPEMTGEIVYSKITDSVLPSIFQGEDGSITLTPMEQPQKIYFCPRKEAPDLLYEAPKENNMRYELQTFLSLVQNREINHRSLRLSEETIRILDEIRSQNHILF